jgi:DUF971 family protein
MRATQIKRELGELRVVWDDGHISHYALPYLREECPCAACKGEMLFGNVYRPPALKMFTPGMNELESLTPVGNYGVLARWKDGHDTGIYSWDYLRMVCPCEECRAKNMMNVE